MKILLVLFVFKTIAARPYHGLEPRTIMFGGYYGHPMAPSSSDSKGYLPGTMTFAAGDTIATNTFFGDESGDSTEKRKQTRNQEIDETVEAETSTRRVPKKRPQKPQEEEEDEEDEGSWPFKAGRNGMPNYNAFFPITFGSGGRGRNGGDEGYYPGPATAIANSFSTGKGGVATSHATSYGDPYLSTLLRNGGVNFNRKA